MGPKDICRCTHEREWHNSCSRCRCPFFLDDKATAADRKLWRNEFKVREIREGK